MLPNGIKIYIDNALYSSKYRRNLISLKDIRYNDYHIKTNNEGNEEYLYITSTVSGQKLILEKLHIFSYELYYTILRTIEINVTMHQKCPYPNIFYALA
jgi:hypothetical protein